MVAKSLIISISLSGLFIFLIAVIVITVYLYRKNKNEELAVSENKNNKYHYYNIVTKNSTTLVFIILGILFVSLFVSLSDNNKMKALALISPLVAVGIDKAKCVLKDYLDSVDFSKLTSNNNKEQQQRDVIVISSNKDKIDDLEADIANYYNEWNEYLLKVSTYEDGNHEEKKIHLEKIYDKINDNIMVIKSEKESYKRYLDKRIKELTKYHDFYNNLLDTILIPSNEIKEIELFINQNSKFINSNTKLIDVCDRILDLLA